MDYSRITGQCWNCQYDPKIEVFYRDYIGIKPDDLLTAGSVWYPLVICIGYLVFSVFASKYVKLRISLESCNTIQNLYNATLSACHVILGILLGYSLYAYDYSILCQRVHLHVQREQFVGMLMWIYYVLKILEMGDTIIRVIKPGVRVISFLMLYHRMALVMMSWFAFKYTPGGSALNFMILDCLVHVSVLAFWYFFFKERGVRGANPYRYYDGQREDVIALFLAEFFIGSFVGAIMILRIDCGFSPFAAKTVLLYLVSLFDFKLLEWCFLANDDCFGFWNSPDRDR